MDSQADKTGETGREAAYVSSETGGQTGDPGKGVRQARGVCGDEPSGLVHVASQLELMLA